MHRSDIREKIERLHRSLIEFIAVPALIVVGFIALAEAVDWLDNHAGPRRAWGPLRSWLAQYVGDTQAAIGVLSAIAGSLFTVTSITFSILLLAVQQGATVLNSQIVDHYLRRGSNRAWFGFFVGISLFALITLVQTTHTTAPVFGVMMSTLLGAIALFALIVLIYGTIDQMRPATLMEAIVVAAIAARERQYALLAASRSPGGAVRGTVVQADRSGYLARIDAATLQALLSQHERLCVVVQPAIGAFVEAGDPLALVSGSDDAINASVASAFTIMQHRDVAYDAGYSLHHLHTIGWTAISTARSDPAVGTIAVQAVRSLAIAWREDPPRADQGARLIYDDRVPLQLIDTFESLMVASTESNQHQTLALLLDTLAALMPNLSSSMLATVAPLLETGAQLAASHAPTRVLLAALEHCAAACDKHGMEVQTQSLLAVRSDLAAGCAGGAVRS